MKKLILFMLLALPLLGMAQITEIETSQVEIGSFPNVSSWRSEGFFNINYRDFQNEYIKENIGVKDSDVETLYNKLKQAFELPKGETMSLKLPENIITIIPMKYLGYKVIIINNINKKGERSTIPPMSLKQLDTLFGKG